MNEFVSKLDGDYEANIDISHIENVIGQEEAKRKLSFFAKSHCKETPFPTLLFTGSQGLGKTFMSQKVYEQAETVFEKLATSPHLEIAVRAEFKIERRGKVALKLQPGRLMHDRIVQFNAVGVLVKDHLHAGGVPNLGKPFLGGGQCFTDIERGKLVGGPAHPPGPDLCRIN